MATRWDEYLRWNSAICATVFPDDMAGQPAYLDMDEAVLAKISTRLQVESDDAQGELVAAVRATLDLEGGPSDVFQAHLVRLARWRREVDRRVGGSAVEPPPTVALLAVFTLAAEAMGSDRTVAVHAYYPRLAAVLGVVGERAQDKLQTAYRSAAERLWRGLNDWLAVADGRYGTPTAFALSHRYVGIPLSQALVRAADRRHLARMFRQFGLPPGSDLPPSDLVRVIDTWIQQVPCPASKNLQNLWQRAGAQERIAEVAATELASWDNTTGCDDGDAAVVTRAGEIRLMAQLRRFPPPRLQMSFLVSMRGSSTPNELVVQSADGAPRLDMLALSGGAARPRTAESIDPTSLVDGVLSLADPHTGVQAMRHPRRVVALRHDELANAFVESERVQLGEDSLVLVKDEASLPAQVEQLLAAIARPGFTQQRALRGLPSGWVLFTDVQVLAAPASAPAHTDLNALVPLVSSQLSIAGGMRLPGNLRKWSGLRPPEIRAVSQLGGELSLSLSQMQLASGDIAEPQVWRSQRGVLLVGLEDLQLDDGDYELVLSDAGRVLQRSTLRLRSSDTPDRWTWDTAPALAYRPRQPLSAAPLAGFEDGTPAVRGAAIEGRGPTVPPPASGDVGAIWWSATRPPRPAVVPIVIASPDPTSCVVTGAHRMQLPKTAPGRPTSPMTSGSCTQCGIVKRYPTWPRRSPRRRAAGAEVETLHKEKLTAVAAASESAVDHDAALDALVHLGGGSVSSLDRVVTQVDGSAIAADSFRRHLEALGHLDLSRNDRHEITAWSVAPPSLAEMADGTLFLVGAWSDGARGQLQDAVEEAGGTLSYLDNADAPTSWFVEGLTTSAVTDLLPDLTELLPATTAATVAPEAATRMLRALPALSVVGGRLPRMPLPGARAIERFNLTAAFWEPVETAATPGAYRLQSAFRTLYVYRSEADVERGEAAVGTAQLVKHLEAGRLGRPLVAYYPKARLLCIPRGADLPGLYGRAAVLNSGRLPTKVKNQRAVAYRDVSPGFARGIASLFAR